ncbi:MAG: hypothetical protein WCG23_11160 [bacterium]
MSAQVYKNDLFSLNAKICGASLIISALPLFLVCPLVAAFSNISFLNYLLMLIPLTIYTLILSRFIKSGYISIKENYALFGFNFLASIILLAVGSTVILKISSLSI